MMNIATAVTADKIYPRYLTVMLYSLFFNNPNEDIHVYILHDGLSDEAISMLNRCTVNDKWKDNKRIIPVEIDINCFRNADTTRFSVGTYFRLLMFDMLPDSIDRLLYLDVDLVINKSLVNLYNMQFDGNLIAACSHGMTKEEVFTAINEKKINPKKGECFNAGVVLYDFNKLKEMYSFLDFEEYINDNDIFYDQGILNLLFWNKTKYLPTEIYNNRGANHDAQIGESVIIHYADANPWEMYFTKDDIEKLNKYELLESKKRDCLNEYYLEMVYVWWKYASNTECYTDFKNEAIIMHRFFMDRIVKIYFEKMEEEFILLKFKERLFEQMMLGEFERKITEIYKIEKCIIYGMGYFGKIISEYLSKIINIEYYVDKTKYDNIDIEYREINQIRDDGTPIIVCIWKVDDSIIDEIRKYTKADIYQLKSLVGYVNE